MPYYYSHDHMNYCTPGLRADLDAGSSMAQKIPGKTTTGSQEDPGDRRSASAQEDSRSVSAQKETLGDSTGPGSPADVRLRGSPRTTCAWAGNQETSMEPSASSPFRTAERGQLVIEPSEAISSATESDPAGSFAVETCVTPGSSVASPAALPYVPEVPPRITRSKPVCSNQRNTRMA